MGLCVCDDSLQGRAVSVLLRRMRCALLASASASRRPRRPPWRGSWLQKNRPPTTTVKNCAA